MSSDPPITLALWALSLSLCAIGCADDAKPQRTTPNSADMSAKDMSGPEDLGGPLKDLGPDQAATTCDASAREGCLYPSRGLTYTEREGLKVTEPKTSRELTLLLRSPSLDQPRPIVLWSHGGSFDDQGHRLSKTWSEQLVSHGYHVLHVAHASVDADAIKAACQLAQVPQAECPVNPNDSGDEDIGLLAVLRALDLSAVLDELPKISQQHVRQGGAPFDLERVVVAGWSGGSRGPMLLLGAQLRPSASAPLFSYPHQLPAAAFIMSPTGPGFGGFYQEAEDNSWSEMRGPVLFATGVNDVKPSNPGLDGPTRKLAFELQPADGQRWMLYSTLPVGTGGHGTYHLGDLMSQDPALAQTSEAIASSVRAFLDAMLLDDPTAKAWMMSQDASTLAGQAQWLNR